MVKYDINRIKTSGLVVTYLHSCTLVDNGVYKDRKYSRLIAIWSLSRYVTFLMISKFSLTLVLSLRCIPTNKHLMIFFIKNQSRN
jgi:hypothetical protein